jgi:hypothetical protein
VSNDEVRALCLKEFAALTRHKPEMLTTNFRFKMQYDIQRDERRIRMSFGKREHEFTFKTEQELPQKAKEAAHSLYVSAG